MFINSLAAQTAGTAGNSWMTMLPFVAVFILMYFLMIRPQQQKVKAQTQMQESLKPGVMVMTSAGFIGRLSKVEDKEVHLELFKGQSVRMLKTSIVGIMDNNQGKDVPQAVDQGTPSHKRHGQGGYRKNPRFNHNRPPRNDQKNNKNNSPQDKA